MENENSEVYTKAEKIVAYLKSFSLYLITIDIFAFTLFQILDLFEFSLRSLVFLYSIVEVN
jgi:hypothetical protein